MKILVKFICSMAVVLLGWVSGPAMAADIPCKTAKLIVPWKAGGGTHVLFSIFEKTIQNLDVTPKIKVVTVPGQGGNKGAKEASKGESRWLYAICNTSECYHELSQRSNRFQF